MFTPQKSASLIFLFLISCSFHYVSAAMVYDPNHSTTSTSTSSFSGDYFFADSSGTTWSITGYPGNFTLTDRSGRKVTAKCQSLTNAVVISPTATIVEGSACTGGSIQASTQTTAPATQVSTQTTTVQQTSVVQNTSIPQQTTVVAPPVTVGPPVVVPAAAPSTSAAIDSTHTNTGSSAGATTSESLLYPLKYSVCTSLSVNIKKGKWNDPEVYELQYFLIQGGYLKATPTGYFGTLTFGAVKKFQADNAIETTGFVGPLTRAMIKQKSCSYY